MKEQITFSIFMILLSGKTYTSKQLSERFEVSTKTIYRCINSLIDAGLPVVTETGRNGGLKLKENNKIDCSYFTVEELSSFFSFLKSNYGKILPYDSDINSRIKSTKNKDIVNDINIKSQQMIIDTEIWGSSNTTKFYFKIIKNAISSLNKIKIIYKTNKIQSERVIHPYSLVYKNGIWYVYAFCEKRQQFRLFKLSKIEKLIDLNETFIRQEIDCHLKPWNKAFESNFKTINISFKVNNDNLNEIYDWLGDNVKITESNNTHSICEAEVHYCKGLIHKLIELDDKIIILSPKYIIDDLFDQFNTLKSLYTESI